jgi:hypothetical protein
LVPNISTSLQTTLADEAHIAEGQILLAEPTLDVEKSLIYRAGNLKQSFQKRRVAFRTKVNLKKEQCIKGIPPDKTITITTAIKP